MKKKTGLFIFILICIYIFAFCVHANESEIYSFGHFYYHSHDGYVSISGYLGKEEDIIIPSSISGKPVSEIEDGTFDGCDTIKSIVIPDTVTKVHDNSFTGAGALKKIISNTYGISILANENVEIEYTYGAPSLDADDENQSDGFQTTDPMVGDMQVNHEEAGERAGSKGTQAESDYKETTVSTKTNDNLDKESSVKYLESSDQDHDKDDTYAKSGDSNMNSLGQGAYVEEDNVDKTANSSVDNINRSANNVRIISNPDNNTITVRDSDKEYTLSVDKDGHLVRQDTDGSLKVIDKEHTYSVQTTDDGEVTILDEAGENIIPEYIATANDIVESISTNNPKTADKDGNKKQEGKNTNAIKKKFILTIKAILFIFIMVSAVLIIRLRKKL